MSTSVEVGKKYGKYCIYIRDWDGIDQPQYYPICPASEEEDEFRAGRFRHFKYGKSPAKQQNFILRIRTDNIGSKIQEIINWIGDNIEHYWSFDIDYLGEPYSEWRFSFHDVEDATLFKMIWT